MTEEAHNPDHARRWWLLAVLCVAQLSLVLDVTIVNIALPSAQHDLGFSNDSRQWIVTAYVLAFGSLLLLGGRIGDLFGRKRVFIIGLLGFAGASVLGGLAPSFDVLVTARALQGGFSALQAPSALALTATVFTHPEERAKAFGVFGAVGGAGGAVGLLMGGALTELLNWRWCMFISLVFVLPAAAGAIAWLHHVGADVHPHLDIPGTVAGTLGLFALVYGFSHAQSKGWSDGLTIGALAASVVLLALFVLIETRVAHPLLPLRILADRARATAFIALTIVGAAYFGALLMLTYYLQQTLHYSPIKAGLAFMPMMVAYLLAANIGTRLLPRIGARTLLPVGMLLAGGSFAWLTTLGTSVTYVTDLGLPFLVMGAGVGLVFPPALTMATFAVLPHDTGVASALVSAFNQIGASVGTAMLSTISATAAASYLSDHVHTPASIAASAVHGYTTGFWVSVAILLAGAVICVLVLPSRAVLAARAGQDTDAQQAVPVIG
ncbi:MAG: hypothetical protein QOJ56_466 [Mycobacterium sp.]|jgi:EmrB/QacA subfamily drug resistance transporter|nr:hypothetical protein [Mycobacterium sp.]